MSWRHHFVALLISSMCVFVVTEQPLPSGYARYHQPVLLSVKASTASNLQMARKVANSVQVKKILAKRVGAMLKTMIKKKEASKSASVTDAAKSKRSPIPVQPQKVPAKVDQKQEARVSFQRVKHGTVMLDRLARLNEQHAQQVHNHKKRMRRRKTKKAHALEKALQQIAVSRDVKKKKMKASVQAAKKKMSQELAIGSKQGALLKVHHQHAGKSSKFDEYVSEEEFNEEEFDEHEKRTLEDEVDGEAKRFSRALHDSGQSAKKEAKQQVQTNSIISELLGSRSKIKSWKAQVHVKRAKPRVQKARPAVHKMKLVKDAKPAKHSVPHKVLSQSETKSEGSSVDNLVAGLLGPSKKNKKQKKTKKTQKTQKTPQQSKDLALHPWKQHHQGVQHFLEAHRSHPNKVHPPLKQAAVKQAAPAHAVPKKASKKPELPIFHAQSQPPKVQPNKPAKPERFAKPKVQKKPDFLDQVLERAAEENYKLGAQEVQKSLAQSTHPKKKATRSQLAKEDSIFEGLESGIMSRIAERRERRHEMQATLRKTIQQELHQARAKRAAAKRMAAKRKAAKRSAAKRAALARVRSQNNQATEIGVHASALPIAKHHVSRLHHLMHKAQQQVKKDLGMTAKGRRAQHRAVKAQIVSHVNAVKHPVAHLIHTAPKVHVHTIAASIANALFAKLAKNGKMISKNDIATAVHSAVHASKRFDASRPIVARQQQHRKQPAVKRRSSGLVKALHKNVMPIKQHSHVAMAAANLAKVANVKVNKVSKATKVADVHKTQTSMMAATVKTSPASIKNDATKDIPAIAKVDQVFHRIDQLMAAKEMLAGE